MIRCFTGACYVYNHFVRPYVLEILTECESDLLSVDSIPSEEGFFSSEPDNFDVVDKNISQSAYESDTLIPCLVRLCSSLWGDYVETTTLFVTALYRDVKTEYSKHLKI